MPCRPLEPAGAGCSVSSMAARGNARRARPGRVLTAMCMAPVQEFGRAGAFGAVPELVWIDRGLEVAAESVTWVLEELAVAVYRLPAFTLHRKGEVERVNPTVEQIRLRMTPGPRHRVPTWTRSSGRRARREGARTAGAGSHGATSAPSWCSVASAWTETPGACTPASRSPARPTTCIPWSTRSRATDNDRLQTRAGQGCPFSQAVRRPRWRALAGKRGDRVQGRVGLSAAGCS